MKLLNQILNQILRQKQVFPRDCNNKSSWMKVPNYILLTKQVFNWDLQMLKLSTFYRRGCLQIEASEWFWFPYPDQYFAGDRFLLQCCSRLI
jgi:hypothetical protein